LRHFWRVLASEQGDSFIIHINRNNRHASGLWLKNYVSFERLFMEEEIILCAASAYEQKFYLNPEFEELPEMVQQELKIVCVLYTEEIGGVLILAYDEDGNLELRTEHDEDDFAYDEIGSILKIKELRRDRSELFQSLELYYKLRFLGVDDNSSVR